MEKILNNIRQIMQMKGMKQSSLAAAWGTQQSNVSAILSGKRDIKYIEVESFAELAGMSVTDLIRFPDGVGEQCPGCRQRDITIAALHDLIARQREDIKRISHKNATEKSQNQP